MNAHRTGARGRSAKAAWLEEAGFPHMARAGEAAANLMRRAATPSRGAATAPAIGAHSAAGRTDGLRAAQPASPARPARETMELDDLMGHLATGREVQTGGTVAFGGVGALTLPAKERKALEKQIARDLGTAGKWVGRAAVPLEIVGEASRFRSDVRKGKDPGTAAAGVAGRVAAGKAGALAGAAAGGAVGGFVGGPIGAVVGGAVGGAAGAVGVDVAKVDDALGQAAEAGYEGLRRDAAGLRGFYRRRRR